MVPPQRAAGPCGGSLRAAVWELTFPDKVRGPSVCRCATAFYRKVLELCGAMDVRVRETARNSRGDACCEFKIDWT